MTCDLANVLMLDQTWSPESLLSSYYRLLPTPEHLKEDTSFAQARPTTVDIPINNAGTSYNYINDMMPVCVDINMNTERRTTVTPLAIDIIGRQLDTLYRLPRAVILSISKLLGAGKLQEANAVIGWIIDTGCLLIRLPSNISSIWSNNIGTHVKRGSLLITELETFVGWLNTLAISSH
jgi:hypothetical protein